MKKSLFSEPQMITGLKEVKSGRLVREVCPEYSIADGTYYNWKSQYGGIQA